MPFDSTDFNQPPRRPEPSHGRRRRRRFVLFAAFWGGVLTGGPVAMLAWEAAHEPPAACDNARGRSVSADGRDVQHAGVPAQARWCDADAHRALSR